MPTTTVVQPVATSQTQVRDVFFWIRVVLAVLCPPAAVALELMPTDGCTTAVLILVAAAFVLWLLGWLPGAIFALFIVLSSEARAKMTGWFSRRQQPVVVQQVVVQQAPTGQQAPAAPASRGWFGGRTPAPEPAPTPPPPAAASGDGLGWFGGRKGAPASAPPPPASSGGLGWFGGRQAAPPPSVLAAASAVAMQQLQPKYTI